jgi:myosin heavy subunit
MENIGFTKEEYDMVFKLVASILLIGNIDFEEIKEGEKCQISNEEYLKQATQLLGLDFENFK